MANSKFKFKSARILIRLGEIIRFFVEVGDPLSPAIILIAGESGSRDRGNKTKNHSNVSDCQKSRSKINMRDPRDKTIFGYRN